jgi:CDP-glucose 4,6-dehydratase
MGYIELAEKGYQKKIESGNSFNFGPGFDKQTNVKDIIEKFLIISNKEGLNIKYENNDQLHEAKSLSLNIDKSLNILNWRPQLSLDENLFLTANWYKNFYLRKKCYNLIDNDLDFYFSKLANSQKAK